MIYESDLRKKNPVIRAAAQYLASKNFQTQEVDACFKILVEGADGRYLRKVYAYDKSAPVRIHPADMAKMLNDLTLEFVTSLHAYVGPNGETRVTFGDGVTYIQDSSVPQRTV